MTRYAAALLALGLVAGACSSDAAEPERDAPLVIASANDVFDLPTDSAFEPGPCPINPTVRVEIRIQCGTLRVLEKRDQPDSGTIEVAVMILENPSIAGTDFRVDGGWSLPF